MLLSGSTVTLVPSTSTFVQTLRRFGMVPIDEVPIFVSDSDEMETGYMLVMIRTLIKRWTWLPDMSGNLYKFTP